MINDDLIERLKNEGLLKSAFYSAKIERNKMSFKALKKLLNQELLSLLPLRRREILNVLKDHPYASFDLIQRRFLSVNPKTLHYDLKKLQEQKLVIKIGSTRGAVYQVKPQSANQR
ncbi:hypothetical protein AUK18_02030 [Candidatus Beckwithbacteria bacterium CG2_30_44_31]|uniref:HTH arsR-type domain-containing protein n=1 Tax=Candidatus Beckwithbacteria bacterium CG2_30_44_31 TaxID=1805035 RepID=A0A1J5AY68_9BACT|nr:MAG: hypothetical protein AUK18_02030 [Candidatus Beckwithbacteria bacterium CG2_30_44_31]